MPRQCCAGGTASRPLARRLSRAAASILPGAVLLLLPKCPLCLAAWIGAVAGVSLSAVGLAWMRGSVAMIWVAGAALALASMSRRRGRVDNSR